METNEATTSTKTNVTVTFDSIKGVENEKINYQLDCFINANKLLWDRNRESKITENVDGTISITQEVNAGNRYTFQVSAFSEDEPNYLFTSETKMKQLDMSLIDESQIIHRLYKVGERDEVLNIRDQDIFEDKYGLSTSPNVIDNKYNWGVLDPKKFLFNSENQETSAVIKITLFCALDTTTYVYFLASPSTYSSIYLNNYSFEIGPANAYFVYPDAESTKIGSTSNLRKISEYELNKAANSSNETAVPDKYIFNNVAYIRIDYESDAPIAFCFEEK